MDRNELIKEISKATEGWLVESGVWTSKVADLIEQKVKEAREHWYHAGWDDCMLNKNEESKQ